jgi:alpha-N-arabinofuranosidase
MKAEEWRIYQQRFPALKAQGTFLSIDEFAYIGAPTDLRLALAYSLVLQEMLRYSDFLKMSAFTMGVSTLDVTPTGAALNSTGELFKLYGDRFGAGTVPLDVDGDSPQPAPKFPVGFDHPLVRAGSPTYPLDVIAGLSADRTTLKVAVVNATLHPQSLMIEVKGVHIRGGGTVWRLTGPRPDATNRVGQPPEVTVHGSDVPALLRLLTVPAISASIYEFPVAKSP